MENKEKYYRRAYNCLETLMGAYQNGYNKKSANKFLDDEFSKRKRIVQEEIECLKLTVAVALMGLNKERIEKTNKHSDYENILDEFDVRLGDFPNECKTLLNEFSSKNTISTKYESFLSIIKNLAPNYTDLDYIKSVRNAFLHGGYEIELNDYFATTKIRNKNYFEAEILNPNFLYFVMSYMSNLPGFGLTEKNVIYASRIYMPLENDSDLDEYLDEFKLYFVDYESLVAYDGENTLEKKFHDKYKNTYIDDEEKEIVLNSFNRKDINIKGIDTKFLDSNVKECIKKLIKSEYPNFYEINPTVQKDIILSYVEYFTENPRNISNWLIHYFYLMGNSKNIDYSFFDRDEYLNFNNEMSLLILKSYLILYRVQNKSFEEVDYSLMDIDENDLELTSFDEFGNPANLFNDSYNKQLSKSDNPYTNDEVKKFVLTEVIRDALAHGNVTTNFEIKNEVVKQIIIFEDIYKNRKRIIKMDINTLKKYLSSEAFLPKNCVIKDKGIIKKLV